jgi:hypothetical protein
MSLWDLLVGFSFVMPSSGVMAAAKIERATWPEYGAGIALGLILGTAFAWAVVAAARFVDTRVARRPHAASNGLYRALYFGAAVWVIVGWMSGIWLGKMLIRFI